MDKQGGCFVVPVPRWHNMLRRRKKTPGSNASVNASCHSYTANRETLDIEKAKNPIVVERDAVSGHRGVFMQEIGGVR